MQGAPGDGCPYLFSVLRPLDSPFTRGEKIDNANKPPNLTVQTSPAIVPASGEPFVVLVARHGVIIIHEAFDDEKEGTVELDTPLYMASITKAMCGMMFAQFIDQRPIGLDDPVGKYLPDFPMKGDNAITLRQCFTHTTGLEGHYEWAGRRVAENARAANNLGVYGTFRAEIQGGRCVPRR